MGNKQSKKNKSAQETKKLSADGSDMKSKVAPKEQKKKEKKPVRKVILKEVMPISYYDFGNAQIDIEEYNKLFEACTENLDSKIRHLIAFATRHHQYEFLEYLLVQELMCTQRWSRDSFRKAVEQELKQCGALSRMTPIRYLASYCVKTLMSVDVFEMCIRKGEAGAYSEEGKKELREMTNNAIDVGIQTMAKNIMEVNSTLLSMQFLPDPLIPIIVSYLFPWSLSKVVKED